MSVRVLERAEMIDAPEPARVATPAVEYRVFTGYTESDPHRIGCWIARLDEAGLTLECDEVPERDRDAQRVSWAELHELLVVRGELADDIRHLRHEQREEETSLVRLRCEVRALRAKVVRLRLEAEARAERSGPREAPGIVPIRKVTNA